ncbi:MAG: DUF1449 family protein [Deltaproteobacteria bacterium]|nr:DUF1449 family protein [Deltaproteobacteria bacterium]
MDLLQWQNLMFLLPLLLAVLYLVVLGLGGDGSGHDAGVHHDVGMHHDAAAHHDHDAEHDAGHGSVAKVLSAFGVGKVPLSVLIVTMLVLWGGAGLMCSQSYGIAAVRTSALIAGLVVLCGTPLISAVVGRFIATRSFHVHRKELVGSKAMAIYGIGVDSGEARLTDRTGNLRDVPARVMPGVADITEGTEVVLLRYDEQKEVFIVQRA